MTPNKSIEAPRSSVTKVRYSLYDGIHRMVFTAFVAIVCAFIVIATIDAISRQDNPGAAKSDTMTYSSHSSSLDSQPYVLIMNDSSGNEVGRLFVRGDTVSLNGNADKSAKAFFDNFRNHYFSAIDDLSNKVKALQDSLSIERKSKVMVLGERPKTGRK